MPWGPEVLAMQQDVMYGTSGRQISEQMHAPDAQSHGQMHPLDPQSREQPPQRPQGYYGFAPFQQQGHQPSLGTLRHPEAAPPSREIEPSLLLSLEQPEPYGGMSTFSQHHEYQQQQQQRMSVLSARIQQPTSQPLRPCTVRAFDLEQPLEQIEQLEQPAYLSRAVGNSQEVEQQNEITETPPLQQNRELEQQDNQPASPHITLSSEQADNLERQLVPASQFLPPNQSDEQQYPLPLATHDAVVRDRQLFMDTLDNFLAALGTRLTVPKMGGKDMDLHAMYKEVTIHGGLEQVIRYTRWKEIMDAMDAFLPSPSASFVLRKHYINLLYHYEQVYYFGTQGQLLPPPVPLPAPSQGPIIADSGSPYEVPPEIGSALKKRKRKLDPIQVFGVDPAASVGNIVTGAINGKFEEGYLVTVVVGAEKLTGVLYHVSTDNNIQQFASVPSLLDGVGSEWDAPGLEIQLLGKKKKESLYKKDPNAPRRTRTGYNIFYKEQRARLRQLHPEKDKEISRMVIEMWSRLPEEEKSLYVERGQQDRERYRRELLEYQERLKLQSQIGDGSNGAGQPLAEHDHGAYDGSHDYHVSLDVEGDMISFQGAQSQVPEVEELPPGQGYSVDEDGLAYHVNGPQSQVPESEASGGHVESEQAFEMQEDEGEYPEELMSEEEGDPDLEQAYPEDETAYPGSEQGYDGQEDGSGYPVSDQAYDVQEDESGYPSHVSKAPVHESEVHGDSAVSEQPYYVQEHEYAYPANLHQQQVPDSEASGGLVSSGQVAYQMQDNGQVYHPHLPQSRPEVLGGPVSQQQYYTREGYVYAHMRQAQGLESEALGVPVSSDQAAYHGQDAGLSYGAHLQHQNQTVESGVQARQVASEQAYQDRYQYPMHLPYPQAYSQPHSYPVHFQRAHTYPMHLPETQALQYGHAFGGHVHQPQAMTPEVSGASVPSQQVYRVQDGGHTYHAQEDGQTMPVYKHGSYS